MVAIRSSYQKSRHITLRMRNDEKALSTTSAERSTRPAFNYLRSFVNISAIGHKNGNTLVVAFKSSQY
jgi:hypothetical protein